MLAINEENLQILVRRLSFSFWSSICTFFFFSVFSHYHCFFLHRFLMPSFIMLERRWAATVLLPNRLVITQKCNKYFSQSSLFFWTLLNNTQSLWTLFSFFYLLLLISNFLLFCKLVVEGIFFPGKLSFPELGSLHIWIMPVSNYSICLAQCLSNSSWRPLLLVRLVLVTGSLSVVTNYKIQKLKMVESSNVVLRPVAKGFGWNPSSGVVIQYIHYFL